MQLSLLSRREMPKKLPHPASILFPFGAKVVTSVDIGVSTFIAQRRPGGAGGGRGRAWRHGDRGRKAAGTGQGGAIPSVSCFRQPGVPCLCVETLGI